MSIFWSEKGFCKLPEMTILSIITQTIGITPAPFFSFLTIININIIYNQYIITWLRSNFGIRKPHKRDEFREVKYRLRCVTNCTLVGYREQISPWKMRLTRYRLFCGKVSATTWISYCFGVHFGRKVQLYLSLWGNNYYRSFV